MTKLLIGWVERQSCMRQLAAVAKGEIVIFWRGWIAWIMPDFKNCRHLSVLLPEFFVWQYFSVQIKHCNNFYSFQVLSSIRAKELPHRICALYIKLWLCTAKGFCFVLDGNGFNPFLVLTHNVSLCSPQHLCKHWITARYTPRFLYFVSYCSWKH